MNKDLIDDRFGRFRELPAALAKMGHSVYGVCLSYQNRPQGAFNDGPVCWQSVNLGRFGLGLFKFTAVAQRRMTSTDLIWAGSDSFYGIIACALGKINRIPVIFDIYDNFDEFLAGRLPVVRQLYHWAIRASDALTTFSQPYARYLKTKRCRHAKVTVIENAVRNDLFRPMNKKKCREMFSLPQNAVIIGTAGALYKKREVDLLFDAYMKLSPEYPNLHLAVAGPRDHSLAIPEGEKIHDCGILSFEAVPSFLNALDVAVICYADDEYGKYCFPQKTREMMACDVPIVAANVGSLREIFAGRPDCLYQTGDIQSLQCAIERRFSNRRTAYEKGPTWLQMAKVFEGLMESVSRPGRTAPRPVN